MLLFQSRLLISACFIAASCLTGCEQAGTKGVIVSGKLVKGGNPLAVPRSDVGLGWVQMELVPEGTSEGRELTRPAADGSFKFAGEGTGIAPGKYRLVVLHYDQGPPKDSLEGAFSLEKTPLKVNVPGDKLGGTHDLGVIDLDSAGK